MLLIGTMEWASTIEKGDFFCPNCNGLKSYQRKVSRPFLTLYFIPVVPIGGLREYVLCRGCREKFDPQNLDTSNASDPVKQNSTALNLDTSFPSELRRLIALTIVEDNQVTEAEVQMAMRVFERMVQSPLSRNELEKVCREAVALRISAANYLDVAGQNLSYDQKILAIQAMFAVAGAEGQISPGRLQSLMRAQNQLGLDDVAFQTAIKNAADWVG